MLSLTQMEMNKISTALFDLDGVVFDTEPQYTEFWGGQCRFYHPDKPGLEHLIKGQTLVQIFDRYFASFKEEQPKIVARLDEFEKNMSLEYIAGFTDFIISLRQNDIRTAVVTSSNQAKMSVVYKTKPEFKSLFDAVLTSEDFDKSKPDPDCYLKGAARFGEKDMRRCVVFEDSFNGLKAGRSAGMNVVGLATTNPSEEIKTLCDIVIDNYNGLNCTKLLAMLKHTTYQ